MCRTTRYHTSVRCRVVLLFCRTVCRTAGDCVGSRVAVCVCTRSISFCTRNKFASMRAVQWLPLLSICPRCQVPHRHGHEPSNILPTLLDTLQINSTAGLFIDAGPSYDISDGAIALKRGFHVLAIEARSEVVQHLTQHFNESVATGQLSILHAGVADKAGMQTFHTVAGRGGDTSSLSLSAVGGQRAAAHGQETNVTLTTLDHVVGDAPCAVIKLDIQGYEIEALQGAAGLLARDVAPLVIIEVCEKLRADVHAFKMFHQLQRAGYACYDIVSHEGNRMSDGSLRHRHRCCHSVNATHPVGVGGAGATASGSTHPEIVCHDDATRVCTRDLYTDLVCIKPRARR